MKMEGKEMTSVGHVSGIALNNAQQGKRAGLILAWLVLHTHFNGGLSSDLDFIFNCAEWSRGRGYCDW